MASYFSGLKALIVTTALLLRFDFNELFYSPLYRVSHHTLSKRVRNALLKLFKHFFKYFKKMYRILGYKIKLIDNLRMEDEDNSNETTTYL